MKKVWFASMVVLILGLFASGCAANSSNTKEERTVSLYEMSGFSEVKEGSQRVVMDTEEIAMWKKAMTDSVQQPGIVNMADPHYKVDLGEESYLLWIEKNVGTVMNVKDTHTIRRLTPKYAKTVYDAIQVHYPAQSNS